MRSRVSLFLILILLTGAQAARAADITSDLSLGSSGPQVVALQQLLNQSSDTRIAESGPGSPGNESTYFGTRTKAAVMRFQKKYSAEVLLPAGVAQPTGRVGAYTRAKLSSLATTTDSPAATTPQSSENFTPTPSEQMDIYASDKILERTRQRIMDAINTAITSPGVKAVTMPAFTAADYPSSMIKKISTQSALPGTSISITSTGIGAGSAVYFGPTHIVRATLLDDSGTLSFTVPPIPAGRYDVAVRSGTKITNTTLFVVTDPKNPPVHIQNVSPKTISYGGTITLTGSGFTSEGNTVIMNYQTIKNVSSPDGKTITVTVAPESLASSARIGNGAHAVPMSASVVNDYGFSDDPKPFTMNL